MGNPGAKTVGIVVGVLIVVAVIVWFLLSQNTASVSVLGLVAAVVIVAIGCWIARSTTRRDALKSGLEVAVPFITIIAIFIGAGLYFLERKDKFRYAFRVESSVVRMTSADGAPDQVLLTVRIPIENKGARRIVFRCMSIDILHPAPRGELQRSRDTLEEMQLFQLAESIRYRTADSDNCLRGERQRAFAGHRMPPGRPLFIWPRSELEPSDVEDRYFEAPISCQFAFVRVLVKIRISAEDGEVSETKTIIPLTDICRGSRDSSRSVSTPVVEGGSGQSAEANGDSTRQVTGGTSTL